MNTFVIDKNRIKYSGLLFVDFEYKGKHQIKKMIKIIYGANIFYFDLERSAILNALLFYFVYTPVESFIMKKTLFSL